MQLSIVFLIGCFVLFDMMDQSTGTFNKKPLQKSPKQSVRQTVQRTPNGVVRRTVRRTGDNRSSNGNNQCQNNRKKPKPVDRTKRRVNCGTTRRTTQKPIKCTTQPSRRPTPTTTSRPTSRPTTLPIPITTSRPTPRPTHRPTPTSTETPTTNTAPRTAPSVTCSTTTRRPVCPPKPHPACGPGGKDCPDCPPQDELCMDLLYELWTLREWILVCVCGEAPWD